MPTIDATADGYALALEEARRALDEQERAVAHLSTRAGMMLSAGAIVTSFLGGPVLARGDLGPATWIALAAFAAHGVATLSILRPRHEWQFALLPAPLIAEYVEPIEHAPPPAHGIRRDIALHMGDSAEQNQRMLEELAKGFNTTYVLLAIEVLAWIVAIVLSG